MHNFCHWPTQGSVELNEYLEKSIESFCGRSSCRLVFDTFKCLCPRPLSEETKSGKCKLLDDCSATVRDKCPKDKLCKLNTRHSEKRFDCKCPIEMMPDSSGEHCKQIESKEYVWPCLPGYLPNDEMRRDYRQKCIKGQSSLNLKFQIRFDLGAGNNSEILLGDYFDLEQDIDLDRIPSSLIKDFVNYKETALIYAMDRALNKELVKRKMEIIIENGIKAQVFNRHFHRECYAIPTVKFDTETFSLLRLEETLVDVNLAVTCKTYTTGEMFKNSFTFYLRYNYFDSNYEIFQNVGHVLPESIAYD